MGIINVLSPQMANLIAAGEVVERPGSVVKEIVENSIDAGSTHIEVEIQNGGTTYIRVSDDGHGIESDDVEKIFLRHATSKIKEPSDMLKISTMGFRGEALAAISSVSKIDVFTRTELSIDGVHAACEGGEPSETEETGCPKGTTITVRDLFYNVPARMKFLKKDATEAAYCENAVVNAALAHPEISFKFVKDGRESFFTVGNGSLLQVISAVNGKETAKELIPVQGTFPEVEITGFVSDVGTTRASRSMQYFLVNGRPVKGKILSAAVDSAYKGRIMPGRHPIVVLAIKLPYTAVDVNVHPAKLEVKFVREKDIFSAIHNTIDMALESEEGFPEIKDGVLNIPAEKTPQPKEDNLTGYQQELGITVTGDGHIVADEGGFAQKGSLSSSRTEMDREKPVTLQDSGEEPDFDESMFHINKMSLVPPKKPRPQESFSYGFDSEPEKPQAGTSYSEDSYNSGPAQVQEAAPVQEEHETPEEPAAVTEEPQEAAYRKPAEEMRVIGEAFDTYIIVQQGEGLWLIDKHAAHERIIYNELILNEEENHMQTLLKPVFVSMTAEEKQACTDNMELIEKTGFEIEDYGLNGLSVRGAPTYLSEDDIPFVLSDMAQRLIDGFEPGCIVLEELLKSISCKAAIKGGSYSSPEEMKTIAEQVLSRPDLKNCPHGRPIAVFMTRYQLEKQFKRIL